MSLLVELKRRKVFQVAVAYLVIAWATMQVIDVIDEPLNLPTWFATVVILLLAIGFPIAILFSWAFDVTSRGVVRDDDNLPSQRTAGPLGIDYGKATYDLFTEASIRAHDTLDRRLEGREFICGDYSLVDIAAMGSTVPLLLHGIESLDGLPNLARWYRAVRERPAVERGIAVGRDVPSGLPDYYAAALFDDGWQDRVG